MPQANELMRHMYLKIGGKNASEEVYRSIISIEVDDSLHLPDMFSIHLRDPNFKLTDSDTFELGKLVEIAARGDTGTTKLLSGEVTAVEPQFSPIAAPTVVVRGYDQSHRLHRAKQTKTFVQETDGDIAKKVARGCGLKADVDSTREVHEYVCQDNQTDMEFLQDRAKRIGYRLYVEGDTLYFKQAPGADPQVPVLEWGKNLHEFQARETTAQQVTEVIVRSWDPKTKKEIIGRATTPKGTPETGEQRSGGQAVKKAFNIDSKEIVINRPMPTQAAADAQAQSLCDEMGNAFIQVEGSCAGNPAVQAGARVEIKGVAKRFCGKYRVTHAVHRYDKGGYSTHFEISSRANTLGQLLTTKSGSWHSVAIGIVTNNNDPDKMGRVKVRFPALPGNEESNWARVVAPAAGDHRGIMFMPEVNDEVVVAFEHDDTNRPFVLGALWNGKDKPPEDISKVVNSTGKVDKRIIRSRSGHVITLDDTDGGGKISIVDNTGKNSIEIDSQKNSLTIGTDDKVDLHTKSGHKILLDDMGGKIEIVDKTGSNSIKINSMQNSITVESAMQLKIKSQMVEIEAGANMTIKSTGILTIQGAIVKIN